ncbi:MAG: hypothetical protein ACXWXF_03780 [Aeromicrobium sp.]
MDPILHRDAARRGVSARQLRNASWAHPADGVAISRHAVEDLDTVCEALSLVLPTDAVFTHITGAKLRGWWLPMTPDDLVVACTEGEAPHHNRRGVYVRRCEIPTGHRETLRGIRVASAEWTIAELAEHLSLIDLVIVIDCALHRKDTTIEKLSLALIPGRRGVRAFRQALGLCDGRSESPWETALRLLFELSGIRVQPQKVLLDRQGAFVARVDLLICGTHRVAEYDGAGHREKLQHRDDLRREKSLSRIGYERFGYTDVEIRRQPALVIRDGEEALGLRHDPSRLESWKIEFARSSLSARGRSALIRRLRRFARPTTPRPTRPPSGANSRSSGANSSV